MSETTSSLKCSGSDTNFNELVISDLKNIPQLTPELVEVFFMSETTSSLKCSGSDANFNELVISYLKNILQLIPELDEVYFSGQKSRVR